MELFDATFKALDVSLGAAGLRQQTLANNLANVNTPDFKRSDVDFDGVLRKALDEADNGDDSLLNDLSPSAQKENSTTMRTDGNNVDVDVEMANLAENNVRYNALVQLAAKQMNMLQYVISDGKR